MSIKSKIVSTGVEHVGASRRDFLMRSAIVGAAGIAGAIPALASAKNIEQTTAAGDPQKPPDIRPLAQLDSRFPVTYESSVPEALLLLTKYFRAVSARDSSAMVPLLHFPFASYEGTDPVVVESADKFLSGPPLSMNVSGQGPNLVEKDSYDMLDSLEVHTYNPVNVGLSLCYSRFGPDGKKQLECKGIYGVTNNDGKWGIECMSTIFTPADQVDVVYKDAIDATLRLQQNWMLGYSLRDQSVLNSTHQLGPQASLAPPEPRSNAGNARAGKPMDGYRTVGVKSRLHVSNVTAESIAKMDANFPEFSNWAGGGVGPWAYTLNLPNARVLHTSVNKVHSFGGYVRYLQDGTPTSESHVLQIVTYKNERWGNAGALGIMMYHDRTGDVRS
ncbi:MAG: hypothetical protein ABSF97_10615 [Candidatus Sulfotelmatobacter sp.]|jgi:hypothetical protein